MPISKRWITSWSAEAIEERAPEAAGVYELGRDADEETDILYVGVSIQGKPSAPPPTGERGLRACLLHHHAADDVSGVTKFRYKTAAKATKREVGVFTRAFSSDWRTAEKMRDYHLRRCEEKYGALPPGNPTAAEDPPTGSAPDEEAGEG